MMVSLSGCRGLGTFISSWEQALLYQRMAWTRLNTGSAAHALGFHESLVLARRNLGFEATTLDRQSKRSLHFRAGSDTAAADNALRRVKQEIGVRVVDGQIEVIPALAVAVVLDADFLERAMELAPTVGNLGLGEV
ncbi:protein of unknown function [uncultured Woeseiaceae bacterium]|uniref:Uncharacterized protein n=1 Tax=uncultured Woeseiaceae bacterium TaxID=1983305 RepID=A0A7D9H570_9GAMM|nr:protein of unknown function [uncultured Woeseiaceae bacterium]